MHTGDAKVVGKSYQNLEEELEFIIARNQEKRLQRLRGEAETLHHVDLPCDEISKEIDYTLRAGYGDL